MFIICCISRIKLWRYRKGRQRITKIKPFINKYNWEVINYSPEKDDWKKFEKINVTIALDVSYTNKDKIYPAYVSNSNGEKWHYLAVKKLCIIKKNSLMIFIVWITFILSQHTTNFSHIKEYVKIKSFITI